LEKIHGERIPTGKRGPAKPAIEERIKRVEGEARAREPLPAAAPLVGIAGEERVLQPGQLARPPGPDRVPGVVGAEGGAKLPPAGRPGGVRPVPHEEGYERVRPGVQVMRDVRRLD